MRIVVAPDSFKESMTAPEAAAAMAAGVRAASPGATCIEVPMSDGGEGFAEAIGIAVAAEYLTVAVTDARGRPATARLVRSGDLAVVDVASAVGLGMVAPADRDVMLSDSRGVGALVRAALDSGARRLVVGLGGSATNDGGAGMLTALGARLLDDRGIPVTPTPAGLRRLARVDLSGMDPRLAHVRVQAACDVTNPLLGDGGASAVFGPQKGASPTQVRELDSILAGLARLAPARARALAAAPGAGAAGGLGWALMAFLDATPRPGVELLAETVDLAGRVADAALVLTGEGSVDAQTMSGKTVAGVAHIAERAGVPCVVLAGRIGPGAEGLIEHGVTALVPIVAEVADLGTVLRDGPRNLARTSEAAVRIFLAGAASAATSHRN